MLSKSNFVIVMFIISTLFCSYATYEYYHLYITQKNINSTEFSNLQLLSQKQDQLFNACENKYQSAIDGNIPLANSLVEEINTLKSQIQSLEIQYFHIADLL